MAKKEVKRPFLFMAGIIYYAKPRRVSNAGNAPYLVKGVATYEGNRWMGKGGTYKLSVAHREKCYNHVFLATSYTLNTR